MEKKLSSIGEKLENIQDRMDVLEDRQSVLEKEAKAKPDNAAKASGQSRKRKTPTALQVILRRNDCIYLYNTLSVVPWLRVKYGRSIQYLMKQTK